MAVTETHKHGPEINQTKSPWRHVWPTALGIIANLMYLNVRACMSVYVCLTHSPTDSRFCFSSCLIRGLPTLTFRGEVGDFWLAGWMKWANSSVCFSRNSNLFARSVFYSQERDKGFWANYDLQTICTSQSFVKNYPEKKTLLYETKVWDILKLHDLYSIN